MSETSEGIPKTRQFVHLHLHTEYSLLDGGNRVDRLVARVKELGMGAVAITDHGNLFGAIAFHDACRAAGIKPILGCEAYVAPGPRADRTHTGVADGGHHLVLLCETLEGWRNLMLLASEAYLTGFYYKPRIDRELLEAHGAGLIAINGHLGSELALHLVEYEKTKGEEHWRRAVEVCEWHRRVFAPTDAGPRFFVELQHHVPEQIAINPHLIRIARELDLPLVCDNDAHFLRAEEHDAHDTLICISTGKQKDDPQRMRYTPELYVKSPAQMRELFEREYRDVGREACDNTVRIADRCDVDLAFGNHAPLVEPIVPAAPLPYRGEPDRTAWFKRFCEGFRVEPFDPATSDRGESDLEAACDDALAQLCRAGLVWRYGPEILESEDVHGRSIRARLDRELGILRDKSISAYFLIVWDFVDWARQRGIPALARGSGVGTMVGYVLGLSNACPVRYGLLFERFTDPDRSEYPDIDIDLCQDGRSEVIGHVRRKYGHVAQIITFGTLKARAAIRDVGRVFAMPLPEVDKLAKLVPEQLKMTIDKALAQEPELRELADADPQVKRLLDTARVLEGQARHCSVHAAGVVMATRPLHEIVPLYRPAGTEDVVTQWDGPTCEKVGLLKMDFLGLRTLSIIERCKQLVRESLPAEEIWRAVRDGDLPPTRTMQETDPLDFEHLVFDDDRVFELFRRGDTTGVFQFESGGMRRLLTEMRPDRLEDLIAANALYRPGPMDLIPEYNARKHGEKPVPKVHEIVDRFTAETYGIMIYQEQVMQIVHELGGIPLRAAYTLIKAISKKKHAIIDANRPKFLDGAERKGLARKDAEELFELILKFAGYGFNKSHSTGYAIVAYQTALLKACFPNQYMAAFLTYESQAQKVEDWIRYKDDCRRTRFLDGHVGVEIRPPDINLSDADFSVVFGDDEERTANHGHVRFGLRALKGAGSKAIETIVAERRAAGPFESLHEFCERVPPGTVNKATIEALVCCGAFDNVHGIEQRAAMVATIESAVAAGQSLAKDRAAGQSSLFGGGDEADAAPASRGPLALARSLPWEQSELLAREKEVLGFYVSSHPLEQWRAALETFASAGVEAARGLPDGEAAVIGGLVKSVRPIVTKRGDRMAIVTLEDDRATIDTVLFPRTYGEYGAQLTTDSVVLLVGAMDHSRGDVQLIVERVVPVERAAEQLAGAVEVHVDDEQLGGAASQAMQQLAGLFKSQQRASDQGAVEVPLTVVVHAQRRRIALLSGSIRVRPTPEIVALAERIAGPGTVRVRGGAPPARNGRRRAMAGSS